MFSKTSHIPIIEEIARGMKESDNNYAYLELGVSKAACLNKIMPYFITAYAVDVNDFSKYIITKTSVRNYCVNFIGTTDLFFSQNVQKFNMVFIDANHDYNYLKNDFCNSWKCLCDNGIIIMHDTYSPSKEYDEHCKDAYKIQDYLRSQKIDFVTLPFYFGLTIVRKV